MRCPRCDFDNDEGRAVCLHCATPLTAYAGQVTGVVSEETRTKAARLALRPPIVSLMAVLDVLAAIFGPFAMLAVKFSARATLNNEGTNYIGAALGAVGIAAAAALLIPLGLLLLFLAWSTWTQRPWAWTANAVLLGLSALLAVLVFPTSPAQALVRIALSGAVAFFWFQSRTKAWYGMQ